MGWKRRARGVFFRREPELDGGIIEPERAMVCAVKNARGCQTFRFDEPSHALGSGDASRQAEPFGKRIESDELASMMHAARGSARLDDGVRSFDERVLRCAEISEWRARAASPRCDRIDRK